VKLWVEEDDSQPMGGGCEKGLGEIETRRKKAVHKILRRCAARLQH
jgi:hypothetical protein